MPDNGSGIPEEESRGDMAAAWESVHEARRKRRAVHELVRRLHDLRVNDQFDVLTQQSMEPRERP